MQAPDKIETRAGVRGNGSLRLQILEGLAEHIHLGPGRRLERRHHGVERLIFVFNEALPAHHRELGDRLRLPWRRLRPGLGKLEQSRPGKRASRRQRGAALKNSAASKVLHSGFSLWCFLVSQAFSRLPVVSSNRCTSDGSGFNRTLSPGLNWCRSRNTATTCSPPSLAKTWVSEPVGSTTTISASAPSSAMVKCSGRMPYTAGRPSELAGADASGSFTPFGPSKPALPFDLTLPLGNSSPASR